MKRLDDLDEDDLDEMTSSGRNLTNILHEAFTRTDHKSAKNNDSLTVCFATLGSGRVKAVHKMLMKLTPGINLTNILRSAFSSKSVFKSFSLFTV